MRPSWSYSFQTRRVAGPLSAPARLLSKAGLPPPVFQEESGLTPFNAVLAVGDPGRWQHLHAEDWTTQRKPPERNDLQLTRGALH